MLPGSDNLIATGGVAVVSAIAIQYLKNSGWASWFTRETGRANLFLSLVMAFATSLGIHYTWDPVKDVLMITGLSQALSHGIWEWLLQWATQHAAYKSLIVPAETLGEIRALLRDVLAAQKAVADSKPATGGTGT
jgi:hypothetical protein